MTASPSDDRPRPASIRDVAEAAGVSITTVSHALNGKGRIAASTRERVRRAAKEIGYRPSASARSLAGGRTGLLALSVSSPTDLLLSLADVDYFMQLTNAATITALEAGYALVTLPVAKDESLLTRVNVDGAVIVDPVARDPSIAHLRERGVPVVTTGRELGSEERGWWVDNDHRASTRWALDHLEAQGAKRVALITGPPIVSYSADLIAAYTGWCAERGYEPLTETVTRSATEAGGYAAATRLFTRSPPPDAIYVGLDRLALGALLAAQARGLSVPGDVLLAACTDSAASRAADPPLTAVNLGPERIGHAAAEMLIDLVEGREPAEAHRVMPVELVVRDSTERMAARV